MYESNEELLEEEKKTREEGEEKKIGSIQWSINNARETSRKALAPFLP